YGYLRGVQPSVDKVKIDRWIGIEVRVTPELDECFQVRNVKKGAEPVDGLKDKLKSLIWNTVVTLRKEVQSFWDAQDAQKVRDGGAHAQAEEVAARTRDTPPKPIAGQELPEEKREQKIREAAEVLTKDHPERREEVEEEIRQRPVTVISQSWPGSELF